MPSEIKAYDAKTRLPELLRQVQQGARFTITHRGRPVAELTPISAVSPAAREAVEALLNFERIKGVSAEEIESWIAEGRE